MKRTNAEAILPLLPALVAVADSGQVTAAADLLGLPQPTITRALQRAERIIGTPVHAKQGRSIRLTAAGEALVPHLREALRSVESGLHAAGAVVSPVRGRVSIAFQNILGEDLVPALVGAFRDEHPDVEFTLFQGARALCLSLLAEHRADVAFISPPPTEDEAAEHGLEITALSPDELVLIVSRRHRLAPRRAVRLTELGNEQLILMAPGFGLRTAVRDLLAKAGIAPRIAFEGQDIHTLVGLASAGLGVTIVPRRDYTAEVHALRIIGVKAERNVVMAAPRIGPEGALGPAPRAFRVLVSSRGANIAAALYRSASPAPPPADAR